MTWADIASIAWVAASVITGGAGLLVLLLALIAVGEWGVRK